MSNNQIKYEHDITRQNKRQLFERGKSSYVDHGHLKTQHSSWHHRTTLLLTKFSTLLNSCIFFDPR